MDSNSPLIITLIGVLLTGLGFVFSLGAIISFVRARAFVAKAEKVEGVVVSHYFRGGDESSAVVKFTPKGSTIPIEITDTHKGKIGFNVPAEGRQVTVAYDPNNPSSARIDRPQNLYYAPLSLLITGLMLLCFGLAMLGFSIFSLQTS